MCTSTSSSQTRASVWRSFSCLGFLYSWDFMSPECLFKAYTWPLTSIVSSYVAAIHTFILPFNADALVPCYSLLLLGGAGPSYALNIKKKCTQIHKWCRNMLILSRGHCWFCVPRRYMKSWWYMFLYSSILLYFLEHVEFIKYTTSNQANPALKINESLANTSYVIFTQSITPWINNVHKIRRKYQPICI